MIDNKMHSSFLTAACNMTVDEYIDYLVRLKSENPYITWCDIKNLTNEAYELTYSEEFYRKHNRDKLIEYMNSMHYKVNFMPIEESREYLIDKRDSLDQLIQRSPSLDDLT